MVTLDPGARAPIAHGNPAAHGAPADTNVRPAGVGSVSATPDAADGPLFDTTTVKVTVVPATTGTRGPLLVTRTSAIGTSGVETLLELFDASGSITDPGAATVAVL